ncbi:MAG: DUF1559 domain-containing protein [Gemmataceae bacterium]|nr:DUF1559 domain-containing protein [Gemmataceae bacterium]
MSRDDEDDFDDSPRPRRRDDRDDDPDDRPRRRRYDGPEDDFDDRPRRRRPEPAPAGNALAVVGVVLGVLSLCLGPLLGIPAIVCSAVARGRPGGKGLATAGIVLGAVGSLVAIPLMIALLLPAVQKVREAAARQAEMNNQKQIMLGVFNHDAANGNLPAADGPVSWRVYLLPYIEQGSLHQQFDTRQPWDSPRNRPLANTRVKTYASPLDPAGTTDTRYRVFVGPGALFEPGKPPPRMDRVPDGMANTVFAVDAAEAVPWPQPRELPFTPNGPLPAVGHPNRDVAIVAMLDGSVRVVKKDRLTPDFLRALVTPAGGEAVPKDW